MSKVVVLKCTEYDVNDVYEKIKWGVDQLGGLESIIPKSKKVLLKPNMLVGIDPKNAATTHPVVFEATLKLFLENDYKVKYGDSPGFGNPEKVAAKTGLKAVGDKYNIEQADFSNGQGGTLVMGVDDEQNIIGLENDFRTLKNGTKDEFELHLRNLVNHAYGVEFATNNLHIMFPEVNDTEICIVEIKQGLKPLFTEITDKSGLKSKKFYVRSGNSSQEVDITEVASYINQKFTQA